MNRDHQTAGAVWVAHEADFGDGEKRRKYFVLLNECAESGHYIMAVTTSQPRYQNETSAACGCPAASCFRIEQGQEQCFDKVTWVQFDNVFRASHGDFQKAVAAGAVSFIQKLESNRIRSVLNCARKSKDLIGRDKDLIKATLDSMTAASRKSLPSDKQHVETLKATLLASGSSVGSFDLCAVVNGLRSMGSFSSERVVELSLQAVTGLLADALCEAGELSDSQCFTAWGMNVEETTAWISENWKQLNADPRPGEVVTLQLTKEGTKAGKRHLMVKKITK